MGSGLVPDVPGKGSAAGLIFGNVDVDAIVNEALDGGGVDVGIEDLLSAADEEGDGATFVAVGGVEFFPGLFFGKSVRDQVEHGAE